MEGTSNLPFHRLLVWKSMNAHLASTWSPTLASLWSSMDMGPQVTVLTLFKGVMDLQLARNINIQRVYPQFNAVFPQRSLYHAYIEGRWEVCVGTLTSRGRTTGWSQMARSPATSASSETAGGFEFKCEEETELLEPTAHHQIAFGFASTS